MPELDKDYGHKPVLLRECLEALAIRPDGTYVDGTLGRAGHSLEILRRLTEGGRLIGIDRDMAAIEAARERLAAFSDRVTLVHGNFSDLGNILRDLGVEAVDGGVLPPAGRGPAGLQLHARRPLGHAYGYHGGSGRPAGGEHLEL